MPTLEQYRDPVIQGLGGFQRGVVDLNPELQDPDAGRSLISGALYDREKTSDAFGGQYLWIPPLSDNRRVEARGYSVRYVEVFEPPEEGTYTLAFYGYGQTKPIYAGASASMIQRAIHQIDQHDLTLVTVDAADDDCFNLRLPFEISVGCSAGRLLGAGGLGVLLSSQGYSRALTQGMPWLLSPKIPFTTTDGVTGINDCINQALSDLLLSRLLPVTATAPPGQRPYVFNPRDLYPWLTRRWITNYYGPTEWQTTWQFLPSTTNSYRLSVRTYRLNGPTDAVFNVLSTGAEIEAGLNSLAGLYGFAVTPHERCDQYTITWTQRYYNPQLLPSYGTVLSTETIKLREPYPLWVKPYYLADAEMPTVTDPGLPAGETWFIEALGPSLYRICPQTYPRGANGQLDYNADPIPGTTWIESTSGLVNDLDQAVPAVEDVTDRATRYCLQAIEDASPMGEGGPWAAAGRLAAAQAVSRTLYGPTKRRVPNVARYGTFASLPPGSKGYDYWIP